MINRPARRLGFGGWDAGVDRRGVQSTLTRAALDTNEGHAAGRMTIRDERRNEEVLVTVDGSPLDWRPAARSGSTPPSERSSSCRPAITSVVDAPRLVNSDASPTRLECAVTRISTPAARAAAVNRSPIICADNGTTRSPGFGLVAARSVRRARATPSFTEPHVVHFALLVRLAPADGDDDPVAVGRIDDIGPAQRAHLATPHPRHEQQSRDHRIDPPPLAGDLVGLAAATAPAAAGGPVASTAARSETPNGRAWPRPRSPAVRRYPASTRAVRSPAGAGCPASFARRHAAATGHVMKFAPVEPSVEPPQRAAVGAAGVLADRGLDQAARGRRGRPE